MKTPFACPTCCGHKTVQKPPWIAGDQQTWVSSDYTPYPCPSCNGTGIIWGEEVNWDILVKGWGKKEGDVITISRVNK